MIIQAGIITIELNTWNKKTIKTTSRNLTSFMTLSGRNARSNLSWKLLINLSRLPLPEIIVHGTVLMWNLDVNMLYVEYATWIFCMKLIVDMVIMMTTGEPADGRCILFVNLPYYSKTVIWHWVPSKQLHFALFHIYRLNFILKTVTFYLFDSPV